MMKIIYGIINIIIKNGQDGIRHGHTIIWMQINSLKILIIAVTIKLRKHSIKGTLK